MMRNRGLKIFLRACCNWLRLAVRFKPLRFNDLDTDQRLLFEGACCRVIWDIRGAYLVKLFLNGKKIGSWLPAEFPVIALESSFRLEAKAYGAYRRQWKSKDVIVRSLNYREAERATLRKPVIFRPVVVQDLVVRLKYRQPLTPQPVIQLDEILLDTPHTAQQELALQEWILREQTILENT